MMCKDNYAATVSQITPHGHLKWSNRAVMTITMRPAGVLTGSIVRHNNRLRSWRSCDEVRRAGRT